MWEDVKKLRLAVDELSWLLSRVIDGAGRWTSLAGEVMGKLGEARVIDLG